MQELHGVLMRTPDALQFELKHELLLFDHLHVIGLLKFIEDLASSDNPDSQSVATDLSFLASNSIIEPVSNETINNAIDHAKSLALPPDAPKPTGTLWNQWEEMPMDEFTAYLASPETKALMNLLMRDVTVRCAAIEVGLKRNVAVAPICHFQYLENLLNQSIRNTPVLRVAMETLPVPGDNCAIQDILDFKDEMRVAHWNFRRFLNDLAVKQQTLAEISDDFEWTLNEYTEAMKRRRMHIVNSAVSACVIPAVDLFSNPSGNHLFSLAAGALAINKLRIELLEGEAKAPGRECAYMFEARRRFGE